MEISFKDVVRQAPIMSILLPYLSVIDYINLRRATVNAISPLIVLPVDLLWQRFLHYMQYELRIPEDILGELVRLLCERDDFFLSGGFLLALLRGDIFNARQQDIDFFVAKDSLKDSILEPYFVKPWLLAVQPQDDEEYGHCMDFTEVLDIENVGEKKTKLQFVVYWEKEQPPKSIYKFDLPICRNYFSKKQGLKVFALDDITHQSTTVHTVDLLLRVFGLESRNVLVPLYERNVIRFDKYRQRGFDISLDVSDEQSVRDAIVLDDKLIRIISKDNYRRFEMMGVHNPASCIYTADCRCKYIDDEKRRYCFENSKCECDHHQRFYEQSFEKLVNHKKNSFAREHISFWSAQKELKKDD